MFQGKEHKTLQKYFDKRSAIFAQNWNLVEKCILSFPLTNLLNWRLPSNNEGIPDRSAFNENQRKRNVDQPNTMPVRLSLKIRFCSYMKEEVVCQYCLTIKHFIHNK